MSQIDSLRMDKSALSVGRLTDASDDREYWLSKTPQERLEAVEVMRQIVYGYDPSTAQLQRLLEIAQRPPR